MVDSFDDSPYNPEQACMQWHIAISGVTVVTPIRNDPGRVRSPHANVWGRLVPNHLSTGKKASIRSQIDLPN